MRRHERGFGFIILLVALAAVLLFVARAWRSVAPVAAQTVKPGAPAEEAAAPAASAPEGTAPPGRIPDLREAKRNTDAHASQVQDALKASE